MELKNLKKKIADRTREKGADLFGVCRIDDLREDFHLEIREISKELNTALSFGVPLSEAVMETIRNRPNMIYKAHYQQVNHILNDIAFETAGILRREGFRSLPVPASQILKWKPLRAHLSHREIAFKAGLGWWGRNNLLVVPKHGAKVRLVTVLTDAELPVDVPSRDDCGGCMECLEVCPAGAISQDRELFDLTACHEQVIIFSRTDNYGHLICGLCLQACRGGE